ncbi:MAG: response regulator, CheY-like receiver domain protein [Verrucomicrobiales bacterium]|nr:response regulator, CheY-like receiver domain protein [Verrucomicrobiales bacterium]
MNAPGTHFQESGSRVLMIDDDREFCELVQDYLSPFGYAVSLAHTGPAGVNAAEEGPWQAVILDVMLPGLDGFEVLKKIRRKSDVPVLMLTARGDEMDQIAGLEIGADDYLPKGSSTRQLLARLHSITRRAAVAASAPASGGAPTGTIVIADLRIQPESRTASLGGQPLTLTPGEFDMLLSMARAKGRVKTRDALLSEIRDREWEVFDRAIDVQISALRRKLGDDPKNPRFIRTVRSAGYMLMDPDTAMS